jgi:hypothetical protein
MSKRCPSVRQAAANDHLYGGSDQEWKSGWTGTRSFSSSGCW